MNGIIIGKTKKEKRNCIASFILKGKKCIKSFIMIIIIPGQPNPRKKLLSFQFLFCFGCCSDSIAQFLYSFIMVYWLVTWYNNNNNNNHTMNFIHKCRCYIRKPRLDCLLLMIIIYQLSADLHAHTYNHMMMTCATVFIQCLASKKNFSLDRKKPFIGCFESLFHGEDSFSFSVVWIRFPIVFRSVSEWE